MFTANLYKKLLESLQTTSDERPDQFGFPDLEDDSFAKRAHRVRMSGSIVC